MGAVCCRPTPIDFDGDVNLFHFVLLRCVGKGAFGKVRVVQHKQTKDLYALKYINKPKCVKMKAVANIIQERRLLEEIDHPFIVNLRYAFQDDENCFFVLDLMLGGDLRFHLERLGCLPEDTVRFYVAELASALVYLRDKRIMHRDLKPDNILLDESGHAHITDFNIAVHYTDKRLLTGVAGSMAYMAPEILAKRGYTYPIDWWSLGVCAYELVFGRRPFRGRTNSALTHSISKDPLRFPEGAEEKCSKAGMQFLKWTLDRDPYKRPTCTPAADFDEVRRHPWFKDIDWGLLENKQAPPPFVPDSKKANFDASHELEELLLEDNPLKAKARKGRDINTLSAEMRQMEEQFTIYDFRMMHRRSYYPHNVSQQIVSTVTATSSSGLVTTTSRPVTPGTIDPRSDSVMEMHGSDIGLGAAELKGGQPGFGVEEDLDEDGSGVHRVSGVSAGQREREQQSGMNGNGNGNGHAGAGAYGAGQTYGGHEGVVGNGNGNGNGMQMRDLSEKGGYAE
ncbi:kinase-like protein [Stereum hirsutum FP-91666 SS1]|uniref:kinase-like protein n=1 Tax=Stereum hirsutum (strain FP-91666) TaxID=721885 RepID=UPI000440F940|nr:kinase-like protein [Stereum hirsutum FP-91666 SS1]EIM86609.1 kinase-like protein [Stereum hirsutum FP-91666 SS1]